MPILIKRFLFTVSILFFAVMCWRIISARNSTKTLDVPVSVFAQTLEAGKVQKVSIFMGFDSADLKYTQKDRSESQNTTISTKDLPDLIKKMIDDGAVVEFAKARKLEPGELVLNFLPLAIMFGLVVYIYYLRRKRAA